MVLQAEKSVLCKQSETLKMWNQAFCAIGIQSYENIYGSKHLF